MVKIHASISIIAAAAVLVIAGCGSSDGGSSSSDLAGFAAPGSLVFVEGKVQPSGQLKQDTDAIAKRLGGIDDLGEYVVSKLESSAGGDGEPIDFASEIEPWLGEEGAAAFESLEGSELSKPLIAVQATDVEAAESFVDKRAEQAGSPAKDASYKGVEFKVGGAKEGALGVIGEAVVLASGEKEFKAAVDASQGESLGDEDRFQNAIAGASSGSLADVYVDLGGIVEQSGGEIDAQTRAFLEGAGIEASDATAVASVIPHSDQIEVDVSSELAGEKAPAGDASKLLGSLPASSVAAFAFSEFGEQFQEAVDNLDEEGISPDLEPGELKSSLKQAGVDIDKIAASLDEGAVFLRGSGSASLGGALVVTASSSEVADAVASVGTLLRAARVPGVTVVSGGASGFSVHSASLGSKPLAVVGKGDRVAIGYGLAPALAVLNASSEATLDGEQAYKEAVAALGKTPIRGYVDGPEALRLAKALVPRSSSEFWEAVPYLAKVSYVGIGSAAEDEFATTKLIAGIAE
jgi:hypothetical protein